MFFCCRRVSTQASTRHSLPSRNPCETQRQLTERRRKRRQNRTGLDSRESSPKIKKRSDSSRQHSMAGTMETDDEEQMKHFQRRGNAVKNRNRTENEQGRTRAENEHPKNEERNQKGSQADDARRRENDKPRKNKIDAHSTETRSSSTGRHKN